MMFVPEFGIEVVPLAVKWSVNDTVQNVKIPFNNSGSHAFTVTAQILSRTNQETWFGVSLTENLAIPSAEDVAIFLQCKSNYTSKNFLVFFEAILGDNFRKFKNGLKVLLDESEAIDDGVDPKLKFIIVETLHVIVVFIPMGGTRKFVYPITLRVTMAYLHVKSLFDGGVLQVWMPKDGEGAHPELDTGGNSQIYQIL
jgi:hypothetical protein